MNTEELVKAVQKHDEMLRGNGGHSGLIHDVRTLVEESKGRKKYLAALMMGTAMLIVERIAHLLEFTR